MATPLTQRMLDHFARLETELVAMRDELRDWQPPEEEHAAAAFGARQDEQQRRLEIIAAEFNQLLTEWQANAPHDRQETLRIGENARATNELIAEVIAAIAAANSTTRAAMDNIQEQLSKLRQGRGGIAGYKSGGGETAGLDRDA